MDQVATPVTPLRRVRLEKGKTLNDVADATGIKVPNLSLMERGQMGITPRNAELLVEFLGRDAITEEMILYPERFASVAPQSAQG